MELNEIRQEIDKIDTQMKELFLSRMELSARVIATKKKTGGAVYVPEREAEIIKRRSEGIQEDKLLEYQMFIKQVMGISRTYQYSKIIGNAVELSKLPTNEWEIVLEITESKEKSNLVTALDALALAGISLVTMSQMEETSGGKVYQLVLAGDFSKELARGAILQICREMKKVDIIVKEKRN